MTSWGNLLDFRRPNDPLAELRDKCTERFPDSANDFIEYYAQLQYLTAIQHRCQLGVELDRKAKKVREKIAEEQERGRPADGQTSGTELASVLSPEELRLHDLAGRISTYLELDMESYFIFARMLMDRLAGLTRHFYGQDGDHPSFRSFSDHRKWLLKPERIPWPRDEEYAQYIRDNTYWYETSLQIPRDKLIVHTRPEELGGSHIRGIFFSGRESDPRLVRFPWQLSRQPSIGAVTELRKKYGDTIPRLRSSQRDVYRTLEILAAPDSYCLLEEEDKGKVRELLANIGGRLPGLKRLNSYILDFLDFFGEHFTKLLSHEHRQ